MEEQQNKRSIARDARGRLLPGTGAVNPGGVPKEVLAVRQRLAAHVLEATEELVALMHDESPKIRLAAVREVLDRVMGRPKQVVEAVGDKGSPLLDFLLVSIEEHKRRSQGGDE